MFRSFGRVVRGTIRTCTIAVLAISAVAVTITGGASFWLSTWLSFSSTKGFSQWFTYSCRSGDINLVVYLQPDQDDQRRGSEGVPELQGFGFRDDIELLQTYYDGVERPELVKRVRHVQVNAPWWFVAALFWAYPIVVFIRGPVRRFHRKRRNRCLKCAYDLTGNVSGVCPECGERIQRP